MSARVPESQKLKCRLDPLDGIKCNDLTSLPFKGLKRPLEANQGRR